MSAEGAEGGACYGNGTCDSGLACEANVCVVAEMGTAGGACYGNGTCNAGLSCDAASTTCVAAAQPAPAAVVAPAQVSTPAAPPLAVSGGRWSIAGGLAFPTGDFGDGSGVDPSFYVSMRAGRETISGNTAFTIGGKALAVYWFIDDMGGPDVTLMLFHLGPEARGAYHFGNKVVYAAGGLGLDFSLNDLDGVDSAFGLGMNIELGVDILTSPSSGFGFGLIIHPGFTEVFNVDGLTGIPNVTFVGLFGSYSTY